MDDQRQRVFTRSWWFSSLDVMTERRELFGERTGPARLKGIELSYGRVWLTGTRDPRAPGSASKPDMVYGLTETPPRKQSHSGTLVITRNSATLRKRCPFRWDPTRREQHGPGGPSLMGVGCCWRVRADASDGHITRGRLRQHIVADAPLPGELPTTIHPPRQ